MKTLKEYLKAFWKQSWGDLLLEDAYKQGFIDATKLAAENATFKKLDNLLPVIRIIDKQSILKAIEE